MASLAAELWKERLLQLGLAVQTHVTKMVREAARSTDHALAEAVGEEGGDRIYAIDRGVEVTLDVEIVTWPDACFPLLLTAEGMGSDGRHRFGDPDEPLRWRMLLDPIDGTRMLMYDKRPAWFLAAIAPDCGEDTSLSDVIASVLVELPVSKQAFADAFVTTESESTEACRFAVNEHVPPALKSGCPIPVGPTQRTDLSNGFVSVMSCFPGTRRLAADLAERIAESVGVVTPTPEVFDDQYISTGGQMVQLMTGRDRCVIDLRPLFNRILDRAGGDRFIESHPYDLAGLLAVQNSGTIITDGFGRTLNAPFDVSTGVHWCGYANAGIRALVEPIIRQWLTEHGISE